MSVASLSFFDSSGFVVLQVLQTKPSALFWSSQVREEVQMFDWSYCTLRNLEIVRQKLHEILCKMFSFDNNIKPVIYLDFILPSTIPTVLHHLNPTGRIVRLIFLAT